MIHELLGGVVDERKHISLNPSSYPTSSPTPSISSPSQSAASSPTSSSDAQAQQSLRCPRCDSSNTKFCYYNNYNLTQPRHFCKTCRRYWTKGGALRNVPIGGACRKTKAAVPTIVASKSGGCGGKAKPMTSLDVMGRVAALGLGLDHHHHHHHHNPDLLPPSPILWASMPHSSHLLALLRASQMQNPNPNPNHSLHNSVRIKEEGAMFGGAATVTAEPNCAVNAHGLSLDHHLAQLPINGSCNSSLWRNENQFNHMYHHQQQQQRQQNLLLSDVPTSTGIQELYQRLRSSTVSNNYNCGNDHLQLVANNVGSANTCSSSAATTTMATTTTASVMEPIPLPGGDFGYWNPAMSWSTDLSTATNGAFP